MKLDGAVAIVTGAARNIGRCIALALADAGCQVAALDLDEELLNTLAAERIAVFACDVADPEQASRIVDAVMKAHGRIDILVNVAGWICSSPLYNMLDRAAGRHDFGLWEKSLRAQSDYRICHGRCVAEKMIRRRTRGVIINISSVAGRGNAGQSAYAAAKAGSNALALSWAKELGGPGDSFTGDCAGFHRHLLRRIRAMSDERLKEWVGKIGACVVWVQSSRWLRRLYLRPSNDYLTGTVIELDGGSEALKRNRRARDWPSGVPALCGRLCRWRCIGSSARHLDMSWNHVGGQPLSEIHRGCGLARPAAA
jgi:3-oxoacyl-[acyl-carrier protein] reductase